MAEGRFYVEVIHMVTIKGEGYEAEMSPEELAAFVTAMKNGASKPAQKAPKAAKAAKGSKNKKRSWDEIGQEAHQVGLKKRWAKERGDKEAIAAFDTYQKAKELLKLKKNQTPENQKAFDDARAAIKPHLAKTNETATAEVPMGKVTLSARKGAKGKKSGAKKAA